MSTVTQRKTAETKRSAEFTFTASEVKAHCKPDDGWLVIDGEVYDVSKFVHRHPGGRVIEELLGAPDATDVFRAFHVRSRVDKWLRQYRVGSVAEVKGEKSHISVSEFTRDYRDLDRKLQESGAYRASLPYFAMKVLLALSFLAASVLLLVRLEHTFPVVIIAGLLVAIFLQQAALLGHDLGHNCVFESFKYNDLACIAFGTVAFGVNSDQWKDEHNVHHAITNQVHHDLQFIYLPVWLLDEKELRDKKLPFFAKYLIRIQLFSFLPLAILIGRANFLLLTLLYSLGIDTKRGTWNGVNVVQVLAILAHYTWFSSIVFGLISTWQLRLAFVLAAFWGSGVLHVQLMISHVGTEMFYSEEQDALEFVRFQLRSSRNINSNWMTHWFHGGLQFQIEHHLFPRLPRHRLESVQPLVQDLCRRHKLPYMSDDFFEATIDVLRHFHKKSTVV